MTTDGPEGDDPILARLRESAAGDAAVRQLRRRYDMLRGDYEQLLDRLGELEDRLDAQAVAARQEQAAGEGQVQSTQFSDVLTAPLLKLRDDYVVAAARIAALISGLETLAQGSFKGQRGVAEAPAPAIPSEQPREEQTPGAEADTGGPGRSQRVHVDVRGQGFGELLDFQERLSALEGVSRVSINSIDTERATLVVELEPGPGAGLADDDEE